MFKRQPVVWAPALLLAACAVPVPEAPPSFESPLAHPLEHARVPPLATEAALPPGNVPGARDPLPVRDAMALAAAATQDQDYTARGMFMQYHGDFWLRHRRYDPPIELAFQGMPNASTQNDPGHFDLQDYQFDARVPKPLDPDTYLLLGGFADVRRYQFSSSAEAAGTFDETLVQIGARLGFGTFLSDDMLLEAEFLPNLSSDLDGTLHAKDYQWFGNGLVTFRHSQNLFFKGGFEVSEVFDDVAAYPLLGLSWLMTDTLRLDLLLPRRAEVSWSPSTAMIFYTGFYIDGNEARVRTPLAAGKQHVDVNWQEITWRVGTTFRINDQFSVFGEAGLPVAGDYDWGPAGGWGGTLEPAFLFRAGIGLDF